MNTNLPEDSLFSIGEISRILKVSIGTLRRWEKKGRIVPVRTSGGHRRYNLDAVRSVMHKKGRLALPSRVQIPALETIHILPPPSITHHKDHFKSKVISSALLIYALIFIGNNPSLIIDAIKRTPAPSQATGVLGVAAQGGSSITFGSALDENFNLSLRGFVEGNQLRSTTTTISPLTVANTIKVTNLNVDLLDGSDWSDLPNLITEVNGNFDVGGNLSLSGSALTSSGDLSINLGGGDLVLADGDVINIGGSGADVTYNLIGDSVSGASSSMDSDDDLYIEGNLEVDGSITGTINGTINPGFSAGSVIFQGSSGLAQDNGNFFWDDTNNRLGIGDNTPDAFLEVLGTSEQLRITNTDDSQDARFSVDASGNLTITPTGGNTFTLAAGYTTFNCTDCIDYNDFEDTLDLDASTETNLSTFNLTYDLDSTGDVRFQDASDTFFTLADTGDLTFDGDNNEEFTLNSNLTDGARFTEVLAVTQANNATNDFDSTSQGLVAIRNNDQGSTAPILRLDQNSLETSAIGLYLELTSGIGFDIASSYSGSSTIFRTQGLSGLSSGVGFDIAGSTSGAIAAFTGDYFRAQTTRTLTSGSITDTGNFLDFTRTIENSGGTTFTNSGSLVTLASTSIETSGDVVDSSSILAIAQNCGTGASCTGSVLDITTAGSGFPLRVNDDGTFTDSTPFIVDASGSVGIGTTTPASGHALDIEGQLQITLDGDAITGEAFCGNQGDGDVADTANVTISDCSAAPSSDYMEIYSVEADSETGDIVATSSQYIFTIRGERVAKLTKSTKEYQENAIGIVSNEEDAGDFNSIGYVIKEEDNPMPIALSGRVPVKVSQTSPSIAPGDFVTSSSEAGRAMKATKAGFVVGKALEEWSPEGGKESVLVFVNNTYYQPPLLALDANGEVVTLNEPNPTQVAQATENQYDALNTRLINLEAEILLLKSQQTLGISTESTTNSEPLTTLQDAVITGKLNVGSLVLDGSQNSLDALGTLRLQALALGPIEFQGGAATLDEKGNLKIQKLTIDTSSEENSSIGTAKIEQGKTEVLIQTNAITPNSKVFTSPRSKTGGQSLIVTEVIPNKSFKVMLENSYSEDVAFDWWVVN